MHSTQTSICLQDKRVTRQVVDWNLYKAKWKHLKGIKFPQVGPRPIVDLLIGVDQAVLLYSVEVAKGGAGEPIARLTPLGWTCIRNPWSPADHVQTNLTFLVNDSHELNNLVRRFWDIEGPKETQIVNLEDKLARDAVAESLAFEDGHYSVGLPWKTKEQCSRGVGVSRKLILLQRWILIEGNCLL